MPVDPTVPVRLFDPSRAIRLFPRPEVKLSARLRIPETNHGETLPTILDAEWDAMMTFRGDYYVIIGTTDMEDDDIVIYGSAAAEWLKMHRRLGKARWVKVASVHAYRVGERCTINTHIMTADGGHKETAVTVNPDDWHLCQINGETHHIKAHMIHRLYFTPAEADTLGLTDMSDRQFIDWALREGKKSLLKQLLDEARTIQAELAAGG